MKALLFGAAGQLGTELKRVLTERGIQLTPVTRQAVDITDTAAVEEIITQADPELVINAAAYNKVDVAEEEPQAAYAVNGLAVRNLAVVCRQLDARLVHFSTDYVFDGESRQPYREDDPVHPLGAYAVSKLAGELYARAYVDKALVIRTCGVFGPAGRTTPGGNFPETMLRLAAQGKPIRVVQDHVASPTYAPALAERVADLIGLGSSGVFHIGGGQEISWHAYAEMIFREANLKPELQAVDERTYRTRARRPKYSALSNAKMESAGVKPMPPLEEALREFLQRREAFV